MPRSPVTVLTVTKGSSSRSPNFLRTAKYVASNTPVSGEFPPPSGEGAGKLIGAGRADTRRIEPIVLVRCAYSRASMIGRVTGEVTSF